MPKLISILAVLTILTSIVAPPRARAAGTAAPDFNALDAEALGYFRGYLRFDTSNPPDNTAPAIAYLKSILDREGIDNQVFQSVPGAATLIARLPGPAGVKPLLLMSHADVVPAVAADWSHPPFSADLDDGYVWARGAIDNKAHGIMALATLLELHRGHVALRRGVEMMINPDEEAGGQDGAEWMVRNHWDAFDPAFAVNEGGAAGNDPFGGGIPIFNVAVAEKRVMWLRLTARGQAGHASIPTADNPTLILIQALARLLRHQPGIRVIPLMSKAFDVIAPHEKFPAAFELAHLGWPFVLGYALRGPLRLDFIQALLRDTIAPTMLSGSLKVNVIPSSAEAGLDCRLLPGTDPEAFMARMRKLLADDRITIDTFQSPDSAPPSATTGEMWDAIERVVATDFPGTYVVPWMTSGGTDSRFLREKGVPAYGFIPIVLPPSEARRFHGVDERLSVENLNRGIKATYDLAIDLCAARN
ncbi:MAG TPA: M20/M25/M40 family metallo-hydrolase [Candidatus Binataceae bacterium]|nr:M20/M25/M40 family metallo-hydrolase [Candidatus Binataceae bacterium]